MLILLHWFQAVESKKIKAGIHAKVEYLFLYIKQVLATAKSVNAARPKIPPSALVGSAQQLAGW
ncbi:hypothetical protein GA0071314_3236 [Halomonas sp. HL-93]|nr:hypothetical protein GA0071314_3236 [Halomonas sp. HL-93]SNY97392.1 hypothetical protein SAMN04488142_1974 [Halomonas sp. hl-4]